VVPAPESSKGLSPPVSRCTSDLRALAWEKYRPVTSTDRGPAALAGHLVPAGSMFAFLAERGTAELSIPVVAQRAGVNPTSIYRRWRTREGLLADVAMSRLERDLPLPDTGSLRGDLTTWAASAAADLARPEGRLFLLALTTSIPSTPEAQAERDQHLQRRMRAIRQVTDRAAARGESPPTRPRSPTRSWARSTGVRYGAPSPPIPPTHAHSSTACSA
jgi:AcrR family transcriptional regulator